MNDAMENIDVAAYPDVKYGTESIYTETVK
jgi:hypothetical protein